ncbi:MAG: preprotein translocase subunit SecG [Ignavibacteria bacterium]|nr:preprotein translocase subunit SecG [Ignavibacteria bacterium]MBK6771918.1 preprotein translocase subunit SecG [Ignavibacteria bacterium]MBK7256081.1 preprotein translocase subunit SecG [Ignavibacteria bacterium]MBK8382153.1 preprotein translocase subunit SecG [Ignavibacteria bacterium]
MITLLIILLILISIVLMGVVLLQSSKGNGLAGPIGGSSVTMAFGVRRTSDLLSKSTSILAAVLMVGCIAVNLMVGNTGTVNETLIQKNAGQQQQQLPPNTVPPGDNTQPPVQNNMPPVEKDKTPAEQQQQKTNEQMQLDEKKKQEETAPMGK